MSEHKPFTPYADRDHWQGRTSDATECRTQGSHRVALRSCTGLWHRQPDALAPRNGESPILDSATSCCAEAPGVTGQEFSNAIGGAETEATKPPLSAAAEELAEADQLLNRVELPGSE